MNQNFENPYQASTPEPEVVVATQKPVSITVLGILNLAFGAMGLLWFIKVLLNYIIGEPEAEEMTQSTEFLRDETFTTITFALEILGAALALVLIIAGIGLLKSQPYGRMMSIVYSITACVLTVATLVTNVLLISIPAVSSLELAETESEKGMLIILSAAGFAPVCGFIYPIILLIFMFRPTVKNYLQRTPPKVL